MTSEERERAALGGVVLVAVGYILLHAGKGGGWPWDWDLFSSGERDDGATKPGRPTTPAPPKGTPIGEGGGKTPASGRPGPAIIDVNDPDIRLPDGRVVSGATYRRMLNEGYEP